MKWPGGRQIGRPSQRDLACVANAHLASMERSYQMTDGPEVEALVITPWRCIRRRTIEGRKKYLKRCDGPPPRA
jgi:hypothetical protein